MKPGHQGGYVLIFDPLPARGQQAVIEYDTLVCCHCGLNFRLVKPGKTDFGDTPGTCWTCGSKPICGRKVCVDRGHVPQELQLENMEAGRPVDWTPGPSISLGGLIIPG